MTFIRTMLTALLLSGTVFMLQGCGNDKNTASYVAVQMYEAFYAGDADGVYALLDQDELQQGMVQEPKLEGLLKGKLNAAAQIYKAEGAKHGGIAKIEAVSEEPLPSNKDIMQVTVKISFKDGTDTTQKIDVAKNKAGEYKLKLSER